MWYMLLLLEERMNNTETNIPLFVFDYKEQCVILIKLRMLFIQVQIFWLYQTANNKTVFIDLWFILVHKCYVEKRHILNYIESFKMQCSKDSHKDIATCKQNMYRLNHGLNAIVSLMQVCFISKSLIIEKKTSIIEKYS